MENQLQPNLGLEYIPTQSPPEPTGPGGDSEKKIVLQISDDLINEAPTAKLIEDLQGFQEYDLGNVHYISNTGLANIVDLLKTSLKRGIEVHFLNVSEKIKNKIRQMGMDNILNFS
jgi:anti-anti-sigma factor